MKKQRHWLYLSNELPRIGCGWRLVDVKLGRKWVHVTSSTGRHRQRLSMKAWTALADGMKRYWKRHSRSTTSLNEYDTFSIEAGNRG